MPRSFDGDDEPLPPYSEEHPEKKAKRRYRDRSQDSAMSRTSSRRIKGSEIPTRSETDSSAQPSSEKRPQTEQARKLQLAPLVEQDMKKLSLADKKDMIITIASVKGQTEKFNIGINVLRASDGKDTGYVAHATGYISYDTPAPYTRDGYTGAILEGDLGDTINDAIDILLEKASKIMVKHWNPRFGWSQADG